MLRFIKEFSKRLNTAIELLVFGIGLSMALLVAVQVFSRYVLNHSLFWSEELARYLLVWLTFLGASCAYHRHLHPGVDVLYRRLSPAWRNGCQVLIHLLSIGVFVIMIIYGLSFAHFVRLQATPALQLPKWLVLSVIPISGIILLVHAVSFLSESLKKRSHGC